MYTPFSLNESRLMHATTAHLEKIPTGKYDLQITCYHGLINIVCGFHLCLFFFQAYTYM